MSKLLVNNSEIFKPRYIKEAILRETDCDEETADKITTSVVSTIYNNYDKSIDKTSIRTLINAQFIKRGMLKEEEQNRRNKITIRENEILGILGNYDNNNANAVRCAGSMEYSLFELVSKKYMKTQYSKEFRKAVDEGLIYAHDSAQELYKGINCFTLDPRFVFKKGLKTYGDNNMGVTSAPPKHFGTALNLVEECLGLATTYIAGGVCIGAFNVFFAPLIKGLSDEEIRQVLQEFIYRVNQSHKNRGCVSGDTKIWIKLNGDIILKTFKEISDMINADYGATDLTDVDLEILTVTDNRETKWVKPTLFWRNKPRELYEVTLPKGRSFKCDKYHGLISANNLGVRNILEIKKGTQLCDSRGINYFTDIEKNIDYWNGCLYGFWLGDGYKRDGGNRTTITVGKKDKVAFLDLLFEKLPFECDRTVSNKKTDEKHIISQYVNYHFDKSELVSNELYMDNKNYLAGLITGMINSDGNLRLQNNQCVDCQFVNTNEEYINLLRYAMFYFGIRGNKSIKRKGDKNKKWSTTYRLNFEYNKNSLYLYKQLELRPLFKEALNEAKTVKWLGSTVRYNIKSITPLNEMAETFCFTANGRMIIEDGFILTSNSQSMFSSVNFCLNMPKFLKNQKAIGLGGEKLDTTYGDYIEEADKLINIFTDIMLQGDAQGKPILFPNLIYNVDNADLTKYPKVFELSAKYSLPYFCSSKNNGVEYSSVMGCRTELPSNWTGNPNIDCFNTGNAVYTTLSLPAVALKSVEEDKDFFELLDYYSELIHSYNLNRFDWIHDLWYKYHVADFMTQTDENDKPLYDLDNASLVLGVLGLNECCEILYDSDVVESFDKAKEIISYLRKKTDEWKDKDNLRWGLFATPAENASYKLAQKMVNKYGFKNSKAQGNESAPFYTNSTHVPVSYDIDLITRVVNEGDLQPLTNAGNIENIYLGESYSTPEALMKFTERIRDLTTTYFWAYTTEYAICPKCNSTFRGYITKCPFDEEETDVFSRITGYMTNTKSWNKGKQQELKERHRYEAK